MTTPAMRKQLLSYLENADDKKIIGLYALLEESIHDQADTTLSAEQLQFLNEERKKYLRGEGKSYSLAESKELLRKKKAS